MEYTGKDFNCFLKENCLTPIKFFNYKENQSAHKYVCGLNVDKNYRSEKNSGGLHFFTIEDIDEDHDLINLYINFVISHYRRVSITDDAKVYVDGKIYKADKLILGERQKFKPAFCVNYFSKISDHLKTEDMFVECVKLNYRIFAYIPEHLKTVYMYERCWNANKLVIEYIPDMYKNEEINNFLDFNYKLVSKLEEHEGDIPYHHKLVADLIGPVTKSIIDVNKIGAIMSEIKRIRDEYGSVTEFDKLSNEERNNFLKISLGDMLRLMLLERLLDNE